MEKGDEAKEDKRGCDELTVERQEGNLFTSAGNQFFRNNKIAINRETE